LFSAAKPAAEVKKLFGVQGSAAAVA
jgi:hypothetical protein